jgi:hypothetical protein
LPETASALPLSMLLIKNLAAVHFHDVRAIDRQETMRSA